MLNALSILEVCIDPSRRRSYHLYQHKKRIVAIYVLTCGTGSIHRCDLYLSVFVNGRTLRLNGTTAAS